MKLYNTLERKLEDFKPIHGNTVKMYTCGPTVYNYQHIGNMRTYISEDILEKTLRFIGYDVTRCMNITDVGHLVGDGDVGEDKMAVAAKRENKSVLEIAKMYTDVFLEDMVKLNIKMPDIISNASDNIDQYIKIISKLLDTGYAYVGGNGNIYYDVSKYGDYYKLSKKKQDDLQVGTREDVEFDDNKRNQADFVLWFTTSKFENHILQWDSPFGRGYPGWHIECSGISLKYLGDDLDIHCGAIDAVFPHHTNEIAQSEAYTGKKWCNYWIHMAFLNDETGKMSKSKGKFLTIKVLEDEGFSPLAYRFYCLQSHYRNTLSFSFDNLKTASVAYEKLLNKTTALIGANDGVDEGVVAKYKELFKEALENDLNTASAITLLYDVLKENVSNQTKFKVVEMIDSVLSLSLLEIKETVIDEEFKKYIEEKIEERKEAKKNKDFVTADKIRDELLQKGVTIKDGREGTTYTIV
jgi:cysteinyl-tRNA synthetase